MLPVLGPARLLEVSHEHRPPRRRRSRCRIWRSRTGGPAPTWRSTAPTQCAAPGPPRLAPAAHSNGGRQPACIARSTAIRSRYWPQADPPAGDKVPRVGQQRPTGPPEARLSAPCTTKAPPGPSRRGFHEGGCSANIPECPRGDLNPHALIRALAPQASASAYSATRTWCATTFDSMVGRDARCLPCGAHRAPTRHPSAALLPDKHSGSWQLLILLPPRGRMAG